MERIVKSQDLEYEICVMCGTPTNIPKTQLKGGFKAISEHIGTEIRFTKEQE